MYIINVFYSSSSDLIELLNLEFEVLNFGFELINSNRNLKLELHQNTSRNINFKLKFGHRIFDD